MKQTTKSILIGVAFLLAIAGLAVCGVLMQHHVVAQIHGNPLFEQLCAPTANASCDDVLASKWGKIGFELGGHQLSIPTAAVGFAYFATLAAWFVVIGVPSARRRWLHIVPTLLTLSGLAGAVGFEYIMFAVLGKYCPLCMTTHILILLLTILTLVLWRRVPLKPLPSTAAELSQPSALDSGGPSTRLIFAAFLLAFAMTAAGWFAYRTALERGYAKQYFARWQDYDSDTRLNYDKFLAEPVQDIPISPEDPVFGPADSKFTVVIFSDFLCPACQALEVSTIEPRLQEFKDQFRIVFKHFPLDTRCNKTIPRTLHPGACAAAVAAEAVFLLKGNDAFWTVHHDYFHNPGKFTTDFAFKEAEKFGISRDEYLHTINRTSTWSRIYRNIEEAKRAGVDSTPAIFFNGRRLKAWGDRHIWKCLLSDETLTASASSSQPSSAPATRPAATKPR